jgi:hypothetical protein
MGNRCSKNSTFLLHGSGGLRTNSKYKDLNTHILILAQARLIGSKAHCTVHVLLLPISHGAGRAMAEEAPRSRVLVVGATGRLAAGHPHLRARPPAPPRPPLLELGSLYSNITADTYA